MKELARTRQSKSVILLLAACVAAFILAMGVTAGSAYADVAAGSASPGSAKTTETQEMYRLYNPNTGEHLYTADVKERDRLTPLGWNYEGVGWIAPEESKTPVYRLFNPNADDHHYTVSIEEAKKLMPLGWKYEGVAWYSDDDKGTPLYRQFNPNAKTATHNYTEAIIENDQLVTLGWNAEGIGWYGIKTSTADPKTIEDAKDAYTITIPAMYGDNFDSKYTAGDPSVKTKGTAYTTEVAIGGKVGDKGVMQFTVTCLTKDQKFDKSTNFVKLGSPKGMDDWVAYLYVDKNSTMNAGAFKSLVELA